VAARAVAAEADRGAGLTRSRIASLPELEAVGPGWDALVLAMPRPSPFLLHGWVAEWLRHLAPEADLTMPVVLRDGALVGIAPLVARQHRGLRVGELAGGHESALGDLLVAGGEGAATSRALLAGLDGERLDLVDLFGLPAGSAFAAGAEGRRVAVIERVESPVLDMPDGWEAAYRAKTDSRKRNLHKRRLRQLSEAGELELAVARTADELERALEEAFRLHDLRWEGRPDLSTFGTEAGRRFHRAAFRRLAPGDVLRIVTLRLDGRAVAFFSYFALSGSMVVHRLAFDPAYGRLSPGLVTTLHTLEVASSEGLHRVEFLGGGERYKLELADRFEPMHQAVGLARTPVAAAAGAARVGAIRARLWLKRSERARRLYDRGLGPVRRLRRHAT
jgi:CelD/BcsL family acetyltransferase involved in cellulose biosynthesis